MQRYRHHLPWDGGFHFHAHAMFGTNEMLHKPFTCWAAGVLHKVLLHTHTLPSSPPSPPWAPPRSPPPPHTTASALPFVRQTKIIEMQKDLEHNAYHEHLEFNREMVVGIVSFLLLDDGPGG